MTIRLESKRSDERRTLRHNWSLFLGTATIASQTTTSPDLTVVASQIDPVGGQIITFALDGGTDGSVAKVTQAIVSSTGDKETETFLISISNEEALTLGQVKEYLGLFTSDKDRSIIQMIPRARNWVEDHTELAIVQRQFIERLLPSSSGIIRLSKGPLVSVASVDYIDSLGNAATLVPTIYPPTGELIYAGGWPGLSQNEKFEVTYTAGFDIQAIDDRLIGAMLALVEGEFTEGYTYPDRSIQAATNCCSYLQAMVA